MEAKLAVKGLFLMAFSLPFSSLSFFSASSTGSRIPGITLDRRVGTCHRTHDMLSNLHNPKAGTTRACTVCTKVGTLSVVVRVTWLLCRAGNTAPHRRRARLESPGRWHELSQSVSGGDRVNQTSGRRETFRVATCVDMARTMIGGACDAH